MLIFKSLGNNRFTSDAAETTAAQYLTVPSYIIIYIYMLHRTHCTSISAYQN